MMEPSAALTILAVLAAILAGALLGIMVELVKRK
jgi:hypothetical protein